MSKPRKQEGNQRSSSFQFTLTGLIIFSLALMGGASFITDKLEAISQPKLAESFAVNPKDKTRSIHVGPWGELMTRDISLERPAEYLTDEVSEPQPEIWTFTGRKPEAVKTLLQRNGLSAPQVATLFATGGVTENNSGTVLQPAAARPTSRPGANVRRQAGPGPARWLRRGRPGPPRGWRS